MKAITIMAALILLSNIDTIAQNARLTRYELKPGSHEQFRKVISDYVQHAIADKHNIMAEAYYEKEHPLVLWLIERWAGKINKVVLNKDALAKPAEVYNLKDLEPLTKQQWRKVAKKEDEPLTIMLFVDAKKGTEKDFKTIYHQAMPQFRGEAGVVTYQLSEVEGDGTRFVTYEKFRSDDAFQYHLKFPPIQPVINYLNTNIKRPPFQDGIHSLVEFAPLTRE